MSNTVLCFTVEVFAAKDGRFCNFKQVWNLLQ